MSPLAYLAVRVDSDIHEQPLLDSPKEFAQHSGLGRREWALALKQNQVFIKIILIP